MTWHAILDDEDLGDGARVGLIEEICREKDDIMQRLAKALDVDHDTLVAAAATRELMFVNKLLTQIPH